MTAQHTPLQAEARRKLHERWRTLVARREHDDQAAQALLEEREPDWEDTAALRTTAASLSRLADGERAQLTSIAAALERLDAGSWGTCITCGHEIAEARLRVMPEAARCTRCSELET